MPDGVAPAGYYVQAINKDAPHPAVARLWQEFPIPTRARTLLVMYMRAPCALEAMTTAGTIDKAPADALPR